MVLLKEMKKYESGDKEWLMNYNENKIWAKITLKDHFASSPATVELYFNDFNSIIVDQVATMYMGKGVSSFSHMLTV